MAQYVDPYYNYTPGYENTQYELRDPSPPPRDPAWVGPVPVVRRYLNRIQRGFIDEEFKALKETGIYSLEVHVGHVELDRDQSFIPKEGEKLTVQVKFPTLEFVNVNYDKVAERKGSTGTRCSEMCSSISSFLYSIYSETRNLPNLETGPTDLERVEELEDTDRSSSMVPAERAPTMTDEATTDILTIGINEGKAVLLTLSGLEMIQSLQQHPIRVRARVEAVAGEGSSDVIGEAQTTMMFPEPFRQAVLVASRPEADLPVLTSSSGSYPLLDGNKLKVGDIALTLSLTCLGCAVVHCLQPAASEIVGVDFRHALLLRELLISSPPPLPMVVGPCTFGHSRPPSKTSEEVLQSCIASGKLHVPAEARLQCDWYRMAQETVPGSQQSMSYQEEQPRLEVDYMLRNHKRMCREVIQRKDEPRRRSVLERLDSLLLDNDVTSLHHSCSFSGHISRIESEGSKQSGHSSVGSSKEIH